MTAGRKLLIAAVFLLATSLSGATVIVFEPNLGQTDARVRYMGRGSEYNVFVLDREVVVSFAGGDALRFRLVGSRKPGAVTATDPQSYRVNDYRGNDRTKWRSNIATFGRVIQNDVYAGIDVIYRGNEGRLEIDWAVAAGADPDAVRFEVLDRQGKRVALTTDGGDLVIARRGGEFRIRKPVSFQDERVVPSSFRIRKSRRGPYASIEVASYDRRKPLLIDPVIHYSTYLGGTNTELVPGPLTWAGKANIAVDAAGRAYVTGNTLSADFPLSNAHQNYQGGVNYTDTFVSKLTPGGTGLIYSTYLGGSLDDAGNGIAVDAEGNAYVAGSTSSTNFPTTAGAYATTYRGGFADVFVAKLDSEGALTYATYLGGTSALPEQWYEKATAIAVDAGGNAYITGEVRSGDFPTTPDAFQTGSPDIAGGADSAMDAFVTKLNAAGSALVYSTYLGGNNNLTGDHAVDIAVDAQGQAHVLGFTAAANFPTTAGAYRSEMSGWQDIYVVKLNATGTGLLYSTLFGGDNTCSSSLCTAFDWPAALALDSSGNAFFTGYTDSDNFPTTAGAFQTSKLHGAYAFAAKLNASGSALSYATLLGSAQTGPPGASVDVTKGLGIAVDGAGNALVTGQTRVTDFPLTGDAWQRFMAGPGCGFNNCYDAFLTRLNATGTAVLFSTYLGGSSNEGGHDVAISSSGDAFVVLGTDQPDFLTVNPFMRPAAPDSDVVVLKLSDDSPDRGVFALSASTYSAAESAGSVTVGVNLTGGDGDVTVDYETATIGSYPAQSFGDHTNVSGTLLFESGQTNATFDVPIVRDAEVEGDETFIVRLTNVTGGAALGGPAQAVVSITDSPTITFQLERSSYEAQENGGPVSIVVTRLGNGSPAVSVDYRTLAGTAQQGSDYTAATGTLFFSSGETSKTVEVVLTNDGAVEPEEMFTFEIRQPSAGVLGTPSSATIRVLDEDGPGQIRFEKAEYEVSESASNIVVHVRRVGGIAGDVAFQYATADGSATAACDYTATSGPSGFCCGFTSAEISIPIFADARAEGHETFTISLSGVTGAPLGSPATATIRIIDDELIPGGVFPVADGPEREEATDAAFDGTNFLVAMRGPIGYSDHDPEAGKIFTQLVSEGSALVGPPIETGMLGHAPAVAFDGTNYLLVFDEDSNVIHGQLISTNGSAAEPFAITSPPGNSAGVEGPDVAFGGGNYIVVWSTFTVEEGLPYGALKGIVLSPEGSVVTPEFTVNAVAGSNVSVAFDGTNFLVVWLDANETDIHGRFFSPNGTAVGSSFAISQNALPSTGGVDVAFGGGSYLVVWSDLVGTEPDAQYNLLGRIVTPAGATPGNAIAIAGGNAHEIEPRVAFGAGRFLVSWSDLKNDANRNLTCDSGEGSCADIYGRFYDPNGTAASDSFAVTGENGNEVLSPVAFGATKYLVAFNSVNVVDGAVSDAKAILVAALNGLPCVPPPAPSNITATATSTTRVALSWPAVEGATSYVIERREAGSDFAQVGTSPANSFSDTTVSGGKAYLYRVRALTGSLTSAGSIPDLATTVMFTDASLAGAVVKRVHITQLRTAVNAVRALAGVGAGSYTGTAAVGTPVLAVHITELRSALNTGRGALGLTTGGYTDASLTGMVIKAVHVQQLREGVR